MGMAASARKVRNETTMTISSTDRFEEITMVQKLLNCGLATVLHCNISQTERRWAPRSLVDALYSRESVPLPT